MQKTSLTTAICLIALLFTSTIQAKSQPRADAAHQTSQTAAAVADNDSPSDLHTVNLGPIKIKVNGFLSAGVGISDANPVPSLLPPFTPAVPLFRHIGRDPNWNAYTLGGVQFEVPIVDKLSIITQLISRGSENYNIRTNWAYLNYQATPNLIVQAGRIRIPTFLYSDTIDVGYTYPWVAPPAEVYNQMPIPNLNGAQAIYTTDIHGFDIELQPFIGQDNPTVSFVSGAAIQAKARNVYGGEVSVGRGPVTLRASYLHAKVSLTLPAPPAIPAPPPIGPLRFTLPAVNSLPGSFSSVGAKIDWQKFLLLSEYSWRRITGFIPDTDGWYVLVGYHINPQLMPYLSYADVRTVDNANRNITPIAAVNTLLGNMFNTDQDTIEAGLRIDVQNGIAVKASYQHIKPKRGTRGLFSQIPGRAVNFFNVAVQAVF